MLDTPDLMNGIFELGGAFALYQNVRTLRQDKMVRGVHWLPTGFFAAWGLWNLFYYPNLDQWFSFFGGVAIVSINLLWLGMMVYYMRKEKRNGN